MIIQSSTTPAHHLTDATAEIRRAAQLLADAAVDLRHLADSNMAMLEQHGEEYAQHPATKASVMGRLQETTRNLARAQERMIQAMAEAAAA